MNSTVNSKALEFLAEQKITKFPVDTEKIVKKLGYKIISTTQVAKFQQELGLNEEDLKRSCWSFEYQDCNYIVISSDLTLDQRNNYFAHEVGHKILKHTKVLTIKQQEDEADEFMRLIRAPLALMDRLKIESAKDVAVCSGLDMASAQAVYRDLCAYRTNQDTVKKAKRIGGRFKKALLKSSAAKHKTLLAVVVSIIVTICFFTGYECLTPETPTAQKQPIALATNENQTLGDTLESEALKSSPIAFTSANSPVSVTQKQKVTEDTQCYWTPTGTVYHLYRDCHYIKNSKQVVYGTIQNGLDQAKNACCKSCEIR